MPHISNVINIARNSVKVFRWKLGQGLLHCYVSNKQLRKLSHVYYETQYKQTNWLKLNDYRNYVLDHIKEIENYFGHVLDIGCGDGKALASLNLKNKIGIDFSKKLLKKALQRDPNIHVILGDANHLPFRCKAFGLVILLDVIEHVSSPQRVFEEAKRVTCSDIILTTDYEGIFAPSLKGQLIDRAPKLKLLREWGELTFFREAKPIPLWRGLLFAHGLMIRTRFKNGESRKD